MPAGDLLRKGILKHIALEFHNSILTSRGLTANQLHNHIIQNGYTLNCDLGPSVYSFNK